MKGLGSLSAGSISISPDTRTSEQVLLDDMRRVVREELDRALKPQTTLFGWLLTKWKEWRSK